MAKITRAEAVALIERQLKAGTTRPKGVQHHYGRQELRELLDAIYGLPGSDAEKIPAHPLMGGHKWQS
jgi:hypothetical protein